MTRVRIFGYGSLLNKSSLLETSPDAHILGPAVIHGFRREFSLWDEDGLQSPSHGELKGRQYCAVDAIEADGQVNGLVFEVAESLEDLKKREKKYQLLTAEAFDFSTGKSMGEVLVFSANARDGEFARNSPAQKRYLQLCIDGASRLGEEFLRQFYETTFIGDMTLSDMRERLTS